MFGGGALLPFITLHHICCGRKNSWETFSYTTALCWFGTKSYGKSITTLSRETTWGFLQCSSRQSGKSWPWNYCPISLITVFSKSSPFSGFKGHWERQSEGQASQKASGVNRTGTSWWNSSILLTYDDMIDFPSECSNVGLSSYPHLHLHPASICPPTRQASS